MTLHTYASYKTKKAFKEHALGKVYDGQLLETSLFGAEASPNCHTTVCGPNDYHKWYAEIDIVDGIITKIK